VCIVVGESGLILRRVEKVAVRRMVKKKRVIVGTLRME